MSLVFCRAANQYQRGLETWRYWQYNKIHVFMLLQRHDDKQIWCWVAKV